MWNRRLCMCVRFRHIVFYTDNSYHLLGLNILEKTLDSPLDYKEIQLVYPKGDQSWVFIGRTDVEAETPILWPPNAKSWLIWKAPDAGKDWRQEEKGMTGWDVWMASPTQWTWVWVDSGSWWCTGRPGVVLFLESQRVGHDWVTELNWTKHNLQIQFDRYQITKAFFTEPEQKI